MSFNRRIGKLSYLGWTVRLGYVMTCMDEKRGGEVRTKHKTNILAGCKHVWIGQYVIQSWFATSKTIFQRTSAFEKEKIECKPGKRENGNFWTELAISYEESYRRSLGSVPYLTCRNTSGQMALIANRKKEESSHVEIIYLRTKADA